MLRIHITPSSHTQNLKPQELGPEEEYSETIVIKTEKRVSDIKHIIREKIQSMSFKTLPIQGEEEKNDIFAYSYELEYFLFITITQMIPDEYIEKGWGEFTSLYYINVHTENQKTCKEIEREIKALI